MRTACLPQCNRASHSDICKGLRHGGITCLDKCDPALYPFDLEEAAVPLGHLSLLSSACVDADVEHFVIGLSNQL